MYISSDLPEGVSGPDTVHALPGQRANLIAVTNIL